MVLRAEFAALPSGFDAFLFAPIGDEESGMPLSVMSALARAGFDPWKEAERLSQMRREAARDALGSLISRLHGRWTAADVPRITAQLIVLLPVRGSGVAGASRALPASRQSASSNWPVLLIVMAGVALLLWSIGS